MAEVKRLYRSTKDRMLAGVCGGLAEYSGVDPTVVRLAWIFMTLISMGLGIIGYVVAWILIPEAPEGKRAGGTGR